MVWGLKAVDTGIDDDTPPRVVAMRQLIAGAVRAANSGREYTETDTEFGVAAMLVRVGGRPLCVRCGVVQTDTHPELRELAIGLGAMDFRVSEVHWLYDIPLDERL
ncbi:MAG TPA: hypothetical protein VJM32_05345 [Candidatus Saccharimonadales bacterium]|nr:hypothetical protein [Candidatus Saccharimonadales bacterium]